MYENNQNNENNNYFNYEEPKVLVPSKKKKNKIILPTLLVLAFVFTVFSSVAVTIYMVQGQAKNVLQTVEPDGTTPTLEITGTAKSDIEIPEGAEKLTVPQIAAKVNPSVVGIQADFLSGGTSVGTGIILSEDGYIITNSHVVEGADIFTVVLDTEKTYSAELIGNDTKTDLAVLKIYPEEEITPAEFGDSDALVVGDLAIAIGNPASLELQGTLTGGYISAINRDILVEDRTMTLIQTDASINPGNSGGPLINEYGQVIGINTIKIATTEFEGLGFAIPINTAKPIIDELIAYGHVTGRPSIGISGMNLTKEQAYFNDLPQGFLVGTVDPRSDAYAKGLKEGDIIIGINGEEAVDLTALNAIKDQFKAGDEITLNIYRAGRNLDIDIVLMDEQELKAIPSEPDTLEETEETPQNPYGSFFGN